MAHVFHVIPNSDSLPLIVLGYDWLRTHKAVVNFEDSRLQMYGAAVQLGSMTMQQKDKLGMDVTFQALKKD
jgi:hypothetical protein